VLSFDLAWPRHRFVPRTRRQHACFITRTGPRERAPSVASCVVGVLGSRFSAGSAGNEDAPLPFGTSREHYDAVVINAGAGPTKTIARRPGRVLAPQPKQNTMVVEPQGILRSLLAPHLRYARVDVISLRDGQPDELIRFAISPAMRREARRRRGGLQPPQNRKIFGRQQPGSAHPINLNPGPRG